MPGRVSRRFYVIDYDRCLGNVERIYDLLQQSAVTIAPQIDIAVMDTERHKVEMRDDSFDALAYVRRFLDDLQYEELLRRFIEAGRRNPGALLEEGAQELLDYLESRYPFGILTYGSPDWQWSKIKASLPPSTQVIVIDHKHKVRYIKGWSNHETELFELPPEFKQLGDYETTEEVIIVDDKAAAFDEIGDRMRGYWMTLRNLLPSQMGSVEPTVARVTSFSELISYEEARGVE